MAAVLRLLPSFDGSPAGVEGLRIFLLLTELLHVTNWCVDATQGSELINQIAAAILRLPDGHVQVIGTASDSTSTFKIIHFTQYLH